MQHCVVEGPGQYPATLVPLHSEMGLHLPLPEGVLQLSAHTRGIFRTFKYSIILLLLFAIANS